MSHEESELRIQIVRSARRTKSVSMQERDGGYVVRAPARMSDTELAPIIDDLRKRLERRRGKRSRTDTDLDARAKQLNRMFFGGALTWNSIKWVGNQNSRYGSCTPRTKSIRISDRLRTVPDFVVDYVVVHELAHLVEANHGPAFWALVNQFPKTERARGYLMAMSLEGTDDTSDCAQ
ncbi:MAG: M48 family metallopeptidase [Actinobacteria bacterium]|nr:M48 family metallopeptidase [Actinomycetota bacterium]MCB9388157.1 M48 family metallopeptidase [Acidimicrobiia bacterium]